MTFSVLICVYKNDNLDYFHSAMKSIWDDQSLKPDQIILVRDGTVGVEMENELSYWESTIGSRLNLIRLQQNWGLAKALNKGLSECRTDYVARMDSDDISVPDRFEKQLQFAKENPDIDVFGGAILEFDESGFEKKISYPQSQTDIAKVAKYRSPLAHPAVFYKRSSVEEVGFYPTYYPEDYSMWTLMLNKGYIFANIPEVVLKFRMNKNALTKRRGFIFYLGVAEIYMFMRRIGFIGTSRLWLNLFLRVFVHLVPSWIRILVYRYR